MNVITLKLSQYTQLLSDDGMSSNINGIKKNIIQRFVSLPLKSPKVTKKSQSFYISFTYAQPRLSSNLFTARFHKSSRFLARKSSSPACRSVLSMKSASCRLYSQSLLFESNFSRRAALFLSSCRGPATTQTNNVVANNHAAIL